SVAATALGYLPGTIPSVRLRSDRPAEHLDFLLDQGGNRLVGAVTDVGGGPVAAARVTVTPSDGMKWLSSMSAAPATRTNAEGRYEVALTDGAYFLRVSHPDYVSATRLFQMHGSPHREDVALVPGGSIFGEVLTRDSQRPVAGTRLFAVLAQTARAQDS